jgi:hypothetical protein
MFEYESNSQEVVNQVSGDLGESASESISWQSPDYRLKSKSFLWYLGMAAFVAVTTLLIIFLQKFSILAISEVVVLIAIVVSVNVATNRKPPQVSYSVSPYSLTVNNKNYSLDSFKTFSISENSSGNEEIVLMPNSDYGPPLSLRLDDESKQKVFDIISESVPYKQQDPGFVDKLAKKIGI